MVGLASRAGVAALLVALATLGLGCAQEVGDIDRTQTGLLAKKIFEGEWFMKRTVVDAPYDVAYTFIGEADDVVRVRWDVQEKHLIAYRVTPHIEGTSDQAAVAAFPVEDHVDVIREYNPATGEQSNVIVEDSDDRLWFERGFMRVDWATDELTNFGFFASALDQQPVAHYVSDEGDPDRMVVGVLQENGSWRDFHRQADMIELDEAQYIDLVTRQALTPEIVVFEDYDGSLSYEPACWYYGTSDCAPAVVSIRSSFARVDAVLSDYEPLEYPDNYIARGGAGEPLRVAWNAEGNLQRVAGAPDPSGEGPLPHAEQPSSVSDPYAETDSSLVRVPMFDKFGYFRTERYGYDPLYGEVEASRVYLINRWNIWARSHGQAGEPLPYAQRGTRPIVYYLAPDQELELSAVTDIVGQQWNDAFAATARALTGGQEPGRIFEVRPNTREVDAVTGEVKRRGEVLGDLRYSHLWVVSQPTRAGLLGYGPSSADPITGEIFQADALVYGGPAREYAARGRDIVDLINGRLRPDELAMGENVSSYLARLKLGGFPGAGVSTKQARHFAREHAAASTSAGKKPAAGKRGETRRPAPAALPAGGPGKAAARYLRPAGWADARLKAAAGHGVEQTLAGDPAIAALKLPGRTASAASTGVPAVLRQRLSPTRWASPARRRASLERLRRFASKNMLMAAFYDDAIAGLALELKDLPSETVLQTIYEKVIRSTAEHEVGHTLGLRHNFEGSTDALNYHPEYWHLKGEVAQPLDAMTDTQRDGRMREYQYSAIMDYGGRFNADTAGLGLYEKAAIKFGYGQLVEVFEAEPDEPLISLIEYDDGTFDREFSLAEALHNFRHFTVIPQLFGGQAGIYARKDMPYTTETAILMGLPPGAPTIVGQMAGEAPWEHWEVPYRFCSDEYVFGTDTCYMFDMGADAYEIVDDAIGRYRNYYWFNNFRRERVFFDEYDYMDALYWRYFGFIQNTYQHWVFSQWFKTDTWEWLRGDAEGWWIDDLPWTEASDGGLSATAAAMAGFRFLHEVVATPRPGAYMHDPSEGYYWLLSEAPLPLCQGVSAWDSEDWCSDTNVDLGEGRYFYTVYDAETGYYFYERLKWIGTFYDKILALETMTSPDTYFLGIDTSQSVDQWAISMYSSFAREMHELFAGLAADRYDLFAGVITPDGRYTPPNPFATGSEAAILEGSPSVDPETSFTVQLYALWYGMAWLNANYDNTFNDAAKIWLKGSGEAIEPAFTDPSRVIEFANPFNNRVYVATRPEDVTLKGLGWLMLEQAASLAGRYASEIGSPDPDADTLADLRWRLQSATENIEVVRGLYELYGKLSF